MINAKEAKKNVYNYQEKQFLETEKTVNEIIEVMSDSIEYHSKNGFSEISFCPYNESRFSSDEMKDIASSIFQAILISNGYEIITNNWRTNVLKIRW